MDTKNFEIVRAVEKSKIISLMLDIAKFEKNS